MRNDLISRIEITKFRSFGSKEVIECGKMNVFSGKNDSGKSNILRALNLFFNGQTDIGANFESSLDFNKNFRGAGKSDAKDVVIKVFFNKGKYKDSSLNNGFAVEKTFRNNNSVDIRYFGPNGSDELLDEGQKDRITTILNRSVHYVYIPAIRDLTFRTKMQGMLERIAFVIDKRFKKTGLKESFDVVQENINTEIVKGLGKDVREEMSIETTADFSFSSLLESLLFHTESGIPLTRRGDGLQMNFFFLLLSFVARKDTKVNYILGCEEPEIALEMSRQIALSNRFYNHFSGHSQVFITTHSPAFLFNEESGQNDKKYRVYTDNASSNKVSRVMDIDNFSTERDAVEGEIWGLNYQLISVVLGNRLKGLASSGLLTKGDIQGWADEIEKLEQEKQSIEEDRKNLAEVIKTDEYIVLVEGKWDYEILNLAWKKLYGHVKMPFRIEPRTGAKTVSIDLDGRGKMSSFTKQIIGVFDHDTEGFSQWNSLQEFSPSVTDKWLKKSKYNNVYGLLLPVPPIKGREVYIQGKNTDKRLEIEHYFGDDILKKFLSNNYTNTRRAGDGIDYPIYEVESKENFFISLTRDNSVTFATFVPLFEQIASIFGVSL